MLSLQPVEEKCQMNWVNVAPPNTYPKTFFTDVVLPSSVPFEESFMDPFLLVLVELPNGPLLLTALLPALAGFDSALALELRLRQQK